MEVLGLLRSKNQCLVRFKEISDEFLTSARSGDFSKLDSFQKSRDSTLKALDLFDRKLSEIIPSLQRNQNQAEKASLLAKIQPLFQEKDRLLGEVFQTDKAIITLIQTETNRILAELQSSKKSQEFVKKFKSNWVTESGEGIDQKL